MEDYIITSVKSASELPAVANVFIRATTETDTFWEMIKRYGPGDPFDTFMNVLQESIESPNLHLFKVTHKPTEEVVGMAQWKAPWYVDIPKVDPFAARAEPVQDVSLPPLPPVDLAPEDPKKLAGVAMVKESTRQIGNAYITHIRGKRHVYLSRIGVLPEHQRKGIASKLMSWGTEFADAHGIVAFLNGRPAALKLYESFGFKPIHVTYFTFEDLEVAPVTTMLRLPNPAKKVK